MLYIGRRLDCTKGHDRRPDKARERDNARRQDDEVGGLCES